MDNSQFWILDSLFTALFALVSKKDLKKNSEELKSFIIKYKSAKMSLLNDDHPI